MSHKYPFNANLSSIKLKQIILNTKSKSIFLIPYTHFEIIIGKVDADDKIAHSKEEDLLDDVDEYDYEIYQNQNLFKNDFEEEGIYMFIV